MHKVFFKIASKTTCRSDFSVCGVVEAVQELCELLEQVIYNRHTCMAGMPAEKL